MNVLHVILPALALLLGVIASVYFLVWKCCSRDTCCARPLLPWAGALFLFFWFQVPAILAGLGRVVNAEDFNLFFAFTFPVTFFALSLVLFGLLRVFNIPFLGRKRTFFLLWLLAAVSFFGYHFVIHKGAIETYALPLAGNLFFYIPLRVIIIAVIFFWWRKLEQHTFFGTLGALLVAGESLLGLARNIFVIKQVLAYPPEFWYIVMTSSEFFLITQALSVILLVAGFCFLRYWCHHACCIPDKN